MTLFSKTQPELAETPKLCDKCGSPLILRTYFQLRLGQSVEQAAWACPQIHETMLAAISHDHTLLTEEDLIGSFTKIPLEMGIFLDRVHGRRTREE